MRTPRLFLAHLLVAGLRASTAAAQPPPEEVLHEDEPPCDAGNEPLVIAVDPPEVEVVQEKKPPPPPPPPPPPTPPKPTPKAEPPTPNPPPEWLVAASAAPISVVAYGADAGDYESRFAGVSFIPSLGHITYLSDDSGLTAEFGWQYAMIEVPLTLYRSTLAADVGYRTELGGGHALFALGGANGSGGAALKWWKAELRFPHGTAGYLWHGSDQLVRVGPDAALAMVGAARVGREVQLTLNEEYQKDYHGVGYSFRPYYGARADVLVPPVALSVQAGRTDLAGGEDGDALDEATATFCAVLSEDSLPFGGCIVATFLRADMRRHEPYEGPMVEGSAWFIGASLLFAKVGELAF